MEKMGPKSYCQVTDDGCSRYAEYLREYLCGNEELSAPYIDPDGSWKHIRKEFEEDEGQLNKYEFYRNLAAFLNKREQESGLISKDERWEYYPTPEPGGIRVSKEGQREPVLYLRSDQFGFSAPKKGHAWDDRYPYACFLKKASCGYKYQRAADWVWATRTVGGSFIWPLAQNGHGVLYNASRGVASYIQDRVDLTLLEVKHYYEFLINGSEFDKEAYSKRHGSDVLWISELSKEDSNMRIWLDHFGSFKNFIDFFLMKELVVEANGEYTPKDITANEENTPLRDDIAEELKKPYEGKILTKRFIPGAIGKLNADQLETMLDRVSRWTLRRSGRIEEILQAEF